jgi:DNA-binding FadR family transcriptional regulator
MTMLRLPQNTPFYEQVCQSIEEQIINGVYLDGDKLPTEKQLTEMYKVSRVVIREAIKALKEKGLVETHVAKGTYVKFNMTKSVQSSFDATVRMNPDDSFDKLLQVRLLLEPEIAALAAVNASEEDIEVMRNAVSEMEDALERGDEITAFLKGDFTFHMAIAGSTKNKLIQLILEPVVNLLHDFEAHHSSHVEGRRSQRNHKKILRAIEEHDPHAARENAHAHFVQVCEDFKGL